ncbi:MAG: C45 family autoproteolytic acyltransferase/hydrolase [Candidatus Heimdallarchaeota archaeon]
MSEKYTNINKKYSHIVLEGTNYEVGKQQAELIKNIEPVVKWMTSGKTDPKKLGFEDFESLQNYYEEFCPGITDEFQGFADTLEITPDKLCHYSPPIFRPGNCSQMAAMSSVTKDDHVYVGRSYEFNNTMNDFTLCCLKIKNKIKHMGFTEFILFRDDGMNDHGLCVTITSGGIDEKKFKNQKKGFPFFLVVRSILENCRSVKEAVAYLEKVPVAGFWNFLVTDKDSNAVLFQFFNGEFAVKKINNETDDKILFSTNHYILPELVQYKKYGFEWAFKNSIKRYEIIDTVLTNAQPNITKETIRTMLSKEVYEGLCSHYYTDFMGTLFSIIYDVTDLKADICFGPPTHNKWYDFTLDDPTGVKVYDAILPNKNPKLDKYYPKQE